MFREQVVMGDVRESYREAISHLNACIDACMQRGLALILVKLYIN